MTRKKRKAKRHALIYKRARLIDRLIDNYRTAKELSNFPREVAGRIVGVVFPTMQWGGRGWYKTVYRISSRKKDLVLKVSDSKNIKNDLVAYHRIPRSERNRLFAKIYWKSKYCLLQKYGKATRISQKKLLELRRTANGFRLRDIKADNVRLVDGCFKIVDANLSR